MLGCDRFQGIGDGGQQSIYLLGLVRYLDIQPELTTKRFLAMTDERFWTGLLYKGHVVRQQNVPPYAVKGDVEAENRIESATFRAEALKTGERRVFLQLSTTTCIFFPIHPALRTKND